MDRRTFLKLSGMGSVAFAAGCSADTEKHLYTLVHEPEDMVTGEPTWYASTCRECPAGCGVLAKNREGRVVKVEGNPLHPVNRGKLCIRGQAAVQAIYNPDRIMKPRLKNKDGWQEISFEHAFQLISQQIAQASAEGPDRVAMLTETAGDALLAIFDAVLKHSASKRALVFEPFAFESLKSAHKLALGQPILPGYRMERADMLVGFGADFLETWLSPVEYARKFKAMHAFANGGKGRFVHISAYQSLTAANADQWLACRPGSEIAVVLMLVRQMMATRRGGRFAPAFRSALDALTDAYAPQKVSQLTDIPTAHLEKLSERLLAAHSPLILGSGSTCHGPSDIAVDVASVLLNIILDPKLPLYDFDQRHRVEVAAPRSAVMNLWDRAGQGALDVLLLNNVNPFYALPAVSPVAQTLAGKKPFVVAFTSFMDETAAASDLIFPVRLPLECWDIYESRQAMKAALQPSAGRLTEAPDIGDVFLGLLPPQQRTDSDYRSYLIRRMTEENRIGSEQGWNRMLANGGLFAAVGQTPKPVVRMNERFVSKLAARVAQSSIAEDDAYRLFVAPSFRHFDGRGANRPWLSEIPDAVTLTAWQTLVWVHPKTLAAKGWAQGDRVSLETAQGKIRVIAYAYDGLHPNAMVIPMGQGHAAYGRYARNQGVNPVQLLGGQTEPLTGAPEYSVLITKMDRTGVTLPLACVSGSRTQHHRKIALSVPLKDAAKYPEVPDGLTMNDFPLTLPLPEGYAHHRDIYPSHPHVGYRWGMVVDLDRCIGCAACVGACYAENNVGIVGEKQIVNGREMAWIRIERYLDPDVPTRQIFLPMLCQHCDDAPCEAVCPVYAPHHNKEGLNNQIYNRCIGTRFCAQNCPYKVRRFNWFDWQWPTPLNLQLNPDVTVRSKGVMEKCSFCIQRIKAGHDRAKNEQRTIRDGEVIPACVQTCPTDALRFGNLMDPQSAVRKMIADPRVYQVMGYLNTKPAVFYLKKVLQTI
jgi:anaerobic selenocysteine-containing dehydrogenase/Fe-S-cluster-containing dehydrogenase component